MTVIISLRGRTGIAIRICCDMAYFGKGWTLRHHMRLPCRPDRIQPNGLETFSAFGHLRQSDKKSIAAQAEPWTSRTSHFIIPSNQACRSKIHRSSSSTHHLIETALERQKPATSKGYVNTMYCIVLYTTLTWTTYTKHLHNMGKCKCRWATDDITTTNQPTACPKIVVINM